MLPILALLTEALRNLTPYFGRQWALELVSVLLSQLEAYVGAAPRSGLCSALCSFPLSP